MKLELRTAILGDGVAVPREFPRLGASSIGEYFAEASRGPSGAPAIELDVKPPVKLDASLIAAGPHASVLNDALGRLTGNRWQDRPIGAIGLLFTTQSPEAAGNFGVMFDTGFASDLYSRVPREGCAVFMQAIASRRGSAATDEEGLFTAMHELGHVFNLWHLNRESDPMSFMRSSARYDSPLGAEAWRFCDGEAPRLHHQAFLRKCETVLEVQPGGSDYGERGSHGPTEFDARNAKPSQAALRLRVDAQPRSFWWFEPIELEIELARFGRAQRAYRMPNEIDPGYHRFQIWLEEPDGSRRRYRAPRSYCASSRSLVIAPRKAFRRDISIFGQAGGYTFRKPGHHTIQVLLELPGGGVIRSNRLELELKPVEDTPAFREAAGFFTRPDVSQLLFYRTLGNHRPLITDVEDFVERNEMTHWAPALSYAIGRARIRNACVYKADETRARERAGGRKALQRALAHPAMSAHRSRVAEQMLDTSEP
jgi:hypothetical protein